ncbi:uracil-DNA glycosylase [Candidatus Saccharibacteria bacterium]|nr:uracil-DNA glycosylase [Candidatus Saccharibacteria bacterium]
MHDSWKPFLKSEFDQPYFKELSQFLTDAYAKKTIYPPKQQVFSAFTTDLNDIKVVIIGQDPYHGPHQANGLAFSVHQGIQLPPSLQNIFKEIHDDVGTPIPTNGDLTRWAKQGVMLLNNTLTVEAHLAGSHRGKGWETFTQHVIEYLNANRPHLVFILWGRDARSKKPMIDQTKHFIIESAHPSPLSAYNGFFGSKPFSKCNAKLKEWNLPEIEW